MPEKINRNQGELSSIAGKNGLAIITAEEFRDSKEQFPHHKEMLHNIGSIRYCKVEIYADCVMGTVRVPQKGEQRTPQTTFGFYMTEQSLVLIEDSGNLKQYMEGLADWQQDFSAPNQILLQLIERIVDDDIFYLSHLEKELENLEERIVHNIPNDFFLLLTRYRHKLSEFNAFYMQLIVIGEQMQLPAGSPGVQFTGAWENFTRRTERLQNHVRLLRENVMQLRELYQAQQDMKQNRVMGILTIVTTLFLPLTLLTGWYGMNFVAMPELHWKYGYLAVIGLAILIVILEIIFCKKKKFF